MSTDLGSSFNLQIYANSVTLDGLGVWGGTTAQQDFAVFIENVIGN
jgi:hypothetical protein